MLQLCNRNKVFHIGFQVRLSGKASTKGFQVRRDTATTSQEAAQGSSQKSSKRSVGKTATALIFGIPIIIGLMLWAFLAPTFGSGPSGVPIAISGPEPVVQQLVGQAEQQEEHPDFEVVGSPEEAQQMVKDREAVGAVVLTPQGSTIYTASGNGAAYTQMLGGFVEKLQATGQQVETVDLAPTTQDDPQASGVSLLGLPLAFGGLVSAALCTFLLRGNKWAKAGVLLSVAALGAAVVVWMLHGVYGTIDGSVFLEWLAVTVGIAATSLFTAGLASLIGVAGVGVGAVLTILVANPLSGLATGPWLLPAGWATLGQLMPIGATGFLVRSLAFFDGAGATRAWWVLICWVVFGLCMLAFDRSKAKAEAEAA